MSDWDVVIIGAGIAGVSLGSELARTHRVLILEREFAAAYHATGRSAAIFTEAHGSPAIRALTRASRGAFERAHEEQDTGIWRPIDLFMVGTAEQAQRVEWFCAEESAQACGVRLVEGGQWELRVPLARRGVVLAAAHDAGAKELDVAAIHQRYLKAFRASGGTLETHAEVIAIDRCPDHSWRIGLRDRALTAAAVVNAAGAWADTIARLAGVAPLGLVPMRRTVCIAELAGSHNPAGWPMTVDIDERFYFKPESGALLCSPADETPSAPCDAQPEELDVAFAIDRMMGLVEADVRRVRQRWAGLRTFAPDRNPVVGFDPRAPGFFWFAGQGGYGIQTAPAMAQLGAARFAGAPVPEDLKRQGLRPGALGPARLAPVEALVPSA